MMFWDDTVMVILLNVIYVHKHRDTKSSVVRKALIIVYLLDYCTITITGHENVNPSLSMVAVIYEH